MRVTQSVSVLPDHVGSTLAAVLRAHLADHSWSQVHRLIANRRVKLNGEVWLDSARRVKSGDTIELLARPVPKQQQQETIDLRHLDAHLVVVEKPSGISTVRHPTERVWSDRRKALSLTLEDIVPRLIARREGKLGNGRLPRLRIVQRLDKETSGLVVFARTVAAERALGKQFRAHTVTRRYMALVPGRVEAQIIHNWLVRDRGDGRRGSTRERGSGKEAITHIEVIEKLPGYTLLGCRLETGRTHQIRIHLAERGHPLCGEKVYNRKPTGDVRPDLSGAPRLALHAAELGFVHPVAEKPMHWSMPLPTDLEALLARLRNMPSTHDH